MITKRQKILDAALLLFSQQGLEGTSTGQILTARIEQLTPGQADALIPHVQALRAWIDGGSRSARH